MIEWTDVGHFQKVTIWECTVLLTFPVGPASSGRTRGISCVVCRSLGAVGQGWAGWADEHGLFVTEIPPAWAPGGIFLLLTPWSSLVHMFVIFASGIRVSHLPVKF